MHKRSRMPIARTVPAASIRNDLDALAYAAVRMPATYAAIRASLEAAGEIIPDFAPRSLLDVGADPGTAAWAAQDLWPSIG
jgi:ribosomal protein RSM22 (predicted rRNA methylase)